jgi:cellulose biosynthesis protein BcsQ
MIIALMADKGGVGKTTAAHNLGAELCRHGSVLLIDADKQADLTELCGVTYRPRDHGPFSSANMPKKGGSNWPTFCGSSWSFSLSSGSWDFSSSTSQAG